MVPAAVRTLPSWIPGSLKAKWGGVLESRCTLCRRCATDRLLSDSATADVPHKIVEFLPSGNADVRGTLTVVRRSFQ